MLSKTKVVPYDPRWHHLFEQEAALLKARLADNCVAVHHVGSTSVPQLWAKPKIDIILVVKEMSHILQDLEKFDYEYRGEFNIPFHAVFRKRPPLTNINLHVFEEGNSEIELNLLFRDYLRTHSEARDAYTSLKLELVKQEDIPTRIRGGFKAYTLGKDGFIKKILDQAGFKGQGLKFCTHDDEWAAARYFRNTYFFDKVPMADPYTWTFDHKDHIHFVFYEGTQIIGYAHIQLWPSQRAALRIIVIEDHFRNKGRGGHFLSLCERWLAQQGRILLQAQSSPAAYKFYKNQGYTEMPFNDPEEYEGYPQDIDMGKVL